MTTESPESTEQRCGHGLPWNGRKRPDSLHLVGTDRLPTVWRLCDSPPSPSDAPNDEALLLCPTACDDDCDARYHETHAVPAKRSHDPRSCPSAAPPMVVPDALPEMIRELAGLPDWIGPQLGRDAAAALVALREERDEALADAANQRYWQDAWAMRNRVIANENDALAASLDRVRALFPKSGDEEVVDDGDGGTDVLRVLVTHDKARAAVAAALSPGEPPKEGNEHD